VVLAAVAQDASALKHASAELHGDREVVLTAVAHRQPRISPVYVAWRRYFGVVGQRDQELLGVTICFRGVTRNYLPPQKKRAFYRRRIYHF
jgi:hypothetical protein